MFASNNEQHEPDLTNPNDLADDLFSYHQEFKPDNSFESFLAESYGQEELRNFFSYCSNCQCCDRHQQRCPDDIGPLPDYPLRHGEEHNGEQCQCQCRHLSRWLCRAWQMVQDEQVEGDVLDDESAPLQA